MKIKNVTQINKFLDILKECKGDVFLTSNEGDKYNLKSTLSQYVAIAALLSNMGDSLELWCSEKEDEARFIQFFSENPDIM